MKLLAIDPGSKYSGYVVYNSEDKSVIDFGKIDNKDMLKLIKTLQLITLIEKPDFISIGAGKEVINTIFWAGRFFQQSGLAFQFGRNEMKKLYGLKNDAAVIKFIKENYDVKLKADSWQAFLLIHHYLNT